MNSERTEPLDPQQKLALVLLVKEALFQIDEIAALLRRGHSAKLSRKMLAETMSVLRELSPNLLDEYLSVLVSLADKSPPVKGLLVSEEYTEQIVSAKRAFIERIRRELDVEAA